MKKRIIRLGVLLLLCMSGVLRVANTTKAETMNSPQMQLEVSKVTRVKVTWKSVTGATQYIVNRGSWSEGEMECIATLDVDARSYIDQNLPRGTSGYYQVIAQTVENGQVLQQSASAVQAIKLSGKPERPLIKATVKKGILSIDIRKWYGVDGINLYLKKKGKKYTMVQASKESMAWYPEQGDHTLLMDVSNMTQHGVYYIKVVSFAKVKGKRINSKSSKAVQIRL